MFTGSGQTDETNTAENCLLLNLHHYTQPAASSSFILGAVMNCSSNNTFSKCVVQRKQGECLLDLRDFGPSVRQARDPK